ncbi:MAG: hypothetical protein M3121_02240 [Chloroflexota bacterium]|nr:hypothetical protein [Chloroflexota bacterium]
MTDELLVHTIAVDLARNRLTLALGSETEVHPGGLPADAAGGTEPLSIATTVATLEMGTGGRLLGVELGERYLTISAPAPTDLALARAVTVPVQVSVAAGGVPVLIELSRRGEGYEITYPSGNR